MSESVAQTFREVLKKVVVLLLAGVRMSYVQSLQIFEKLRAAKGLPNPLAPLMTSGRPGNVLLQGTSAISHRGDSIQTALKSAADLLNFTDIGLKKNGIRHVSAIPQLPNGPHTEETVAARRGSCGQTSRKKYLQPALTIATANSMLQKTLAQCKPTHENIDRCTLSQSPLPPLPA
jgi:hypothetical protein